MSLPLLAPTPPHWPLDWTAIEAAFDLWPELAAAQQDPVWHAEGDVWTHTRMCLEVLAAMAEWRQLPAEERELVFLATLLHDIGKPACMQLEDGHITSPRHGPVGAIRARFWLWQRGVPAVQRESIAALVRQHTLPYFLVDKTNPLPRLLALAEVARPQHLALLAEADTRGRLGIDEDMAMARLARFSDYARQQGVYRQPWPFSSDQARVAYFRQKPSAPPEAAVKTQGSPENTPPETVGRVVLVYALPGADPAGWLAQHEPTLPCVTLRDATGSGKTAAGHPLSTPRAVRSHCKALLRHGHDLACILPSLRTLHRRPWLDFFLDAGARVELVAVEATPTAMGEQLAVTVAPQDALWRLLKHWEAPDRTEAHDLKFVG